MKDKINKICTELNDGKIAVVQATEQLFDLYSVIVAFVCDNCQSKEYRELTRSTSQCKKCDHLQAN